MEVVIDAQLAAELSCAAAKDKVTSPFQSFDSLKLMTISSFRAVLLVKLVQILKLKKNCSKAVAEFFLQLLNTDGSIAVSPEVRRSQKLTIFSLG